MLLDGRAVAVKVQRPGVRKRVVEDMEVIPRWGAPTASAAWSRSFADRSWPSSIIARRPPTCACSARTSPPTTASLCRSLSMITRLRSSSPWIWSTAATWARSVPLLGRRRTVTPSPLSSSTPTSTRILTDGFVHADPHPGNVLLTSDGRLALIDLGMVVRVSPELQDALVRLLLTLSEGDGGEVVAVMADLDEKRERWGSARFRRGITSLVQQHAVSVSQLAAERVVGELARIAADCGLRPPSEVAMLGKTFLNLDQVANDLDPNFEPNAATRDHVGEIMRHKMLQSASPANLLSAAMEAKELSKSFLAESTR